VKITGTHKWHISGHIIDASPNPVEVGEDYFEKLDKARKEKLRIELQEDLAIQKQKELQAKKDNQLSSLSTSQNVVESKNE